MSYQSENISELATALCLAQADLQPAAKDSQNPHLKNKYTSLTSVFAALREVLPKHGLAVTQTLMPSDGGKAHVRTTLMHKSGQWIAGECIMPLDKQGGPQGMGSAITYARRYSLSAIVGVVSEEDDDGNAAQGKDKGGNKSARPEPNGKEAPAPSEAQRKKFFALIHETLPWLKGDRQAILQTLSLTVGRELTSSSDLSAAETSRLIDQPGLLLEYGPSEAEYKSLSGRQDISRQTLDYLEQELKRLGAPGQLPPDLAKKYGTGDPSELTEAEGKAALKALEKY